MTIEAIPFMHTYTTTAGRAFPSDSFIAHEFTDAVSLYIRQVFDHAHVVFSAIAFIQMLDCGAGE
jgi:hypothetical protein